MKLTDTIIFSFAILFMLVGIHQAMTIGYRESYWLFMMAVGMLFWYQYRKNANKKEAEKTDGEKSNKAAEGNTKKRKYKM